MPSNLLLLLPILGGYLFIHFWHLLHFRAQALAGHRLILESAIWGLLCVAGARLVVIVVQGASLFEPMFSWWSRVSLSTPFVGTSCLAVLIAPALAGCLNLISGFLKRDLLEGDEERGRIHSLWKASREFAKSRAVKTTGNALQLLFHEAALDRRLAIGLTLRSGKVYTALVVEPPNLSPQDDFVLLLPIMSGYRNESQNVVLTHAYKLEQEQFLAIPVSEILTAHLLTLEDELSRLKSIEDPASEAASQTES